MSKRFRLTKSEWIGIAAILLAIAAAIIVKDIHQQNSTERALQIATRSDSISAAISNRSDSLKDSSTTRRHSKAKQRRAKHRSREKAPHITLSRSYLDDTIASPSHALHLKEYN
ncbi:MAG: hypothetical protein ACI30W_05615 [Muribaculaceae bacterium]